MIPGTHRPIVRDYIPAEVLAKANDAGIRLEYVDGVPVWELKPVYRHQDFIDRIRSSIRPNLDGDVVPCECLHKSDIEILFPDGSFRRPDISIFCRQPDEIDTSVRLIPEAVVEVLSPGYEWKDLTLGIPFYLRQGVKDVIVADPKNGEVRHARRGLDRMLVGPVAIELICGCTVRIPEVLQ